MSINIGMDKEDVHINIYNGILCSHKKWDNAICNSMDGPGDYHTKWIKSVSSVQLGCSVVFDSLQPHESQHARPPCPSQLPEFTQTHVHRVRDAIQPSHLSSPSPPAPNPSQHQGLFQWVSSSHEKDKYHMISLKCEILKKLIWMSFKKQKHPHGLREGTYSYQNGQIGVDMYTLLYLKLITSKALPCSIGNCSGLCNNLNGKRTQKRRGPYRCITGSLCCTPKSDTHC